MTAENTPESWTGDADPWAAWDAGQHSRALERQERPLRLAFYGRCSTEDNQDPKTSRQWQLRAASGLLASAVPGASIVAEYFGIGYSRSLPWKRRPEALRLLADLASQDRDWDAIVVGESQRCWSGSQFSEVAPIVEHHDVTLWVPELGGAYDPRNSAHYIMMTVHGGLGRAERQRVQDRVRLGMAAQVAQQGRFQGGCPPYGYKAVGYAPHPNPRKAAEGYQLKRLRSTRPPLRWCDGSLTTCWPERRSARSRRPSTGRASPARPPMTRPETVTAAATDGSRPPCRRSSPTRDTPVTRPWGKFRKEETLLDPADPSWGHKTRLVRSGKEPVRSVTPSHGAIVSVATWQAAQNALRARSAGGPKEMAKGSRTRTDTKVHALRGIVHCVHCDRKMWAKTRKPKPSFPVQEDGKPRRGRKPRPEHLRVARVLWRCRRKDLVEGSARWADHPETVSTSQSALLDQVSTWLSSLFDPANRETTIDALTAGLDIPNLVDVRRRQTADRLADAQKRLDRLVDSIEAGVDPALVTPRMQAVQEEIAALRADGATESTQPAFTRADVEALVDSFAGAAHEVFGHQADPAELNAFFDAIGLRIQIDGVTKVASAETNLAPGNGGEKPNPHPAESGVGVNDRVRGGT